MQLLCALHQCWRAVEHLDDEHDLKPFLKAFHIRYFTKRFRSFPHFEQKDSGHENMSNLSNLKTLTSCAPRKWRDYDRDGDSVMTGS